jgi:glycosyltransferase involved in cell wall biosynthesis
MSQPHIPLVSIVIPTYDQKAEYLRACIKSAMDQNYGNLEILISNNHSSAQTSAIIEEFRDPRIVLVRPEKHLPLNEHFNFAVSKAKGEYISFISSDDLIYKDCIERTMQPMLNDSHLVLCYNENRIIDANGDVTDVIRKNKLPTGVYSAHHVALRMLHNTEYWVIGSIIKRDAYLKERFVPKIIAADWVLGFKLLKYGNVGYVNEPLAAIRFHEREGSKRAEYEVLKKEHFIQVPEKFGYLLNDAELLKTIGLKKEEMQKCLDEALVINCVILLRKYKAGEIALSQTLELMQGYKSYSSDKWIGILEKNVDNSLGLFLTYGLGLARRLKRTRLKMFTKHIY